MADEFAQLVPETSHHSRPHADHDFSPRCPFCVIARTYNPTSPSAAEGNPGLNPEQLDPPSFVLYSSEHIIAFLDIMPLTRGHVLVAPRKHRIKVGDLSPDEGAEVCLGSQDYRLDMGSSLGSYLPASVEHSMLTISRLDEFYLFLAEPS